MTELYKVTYYEKKMQLEYHRLIYQRVEETPSLLFREMKKEYEKHFGHFFPDAYIKLQLFKLWESGKLEPSLLKVTCPKSGLLSSLDIKDFFQKELPRFLLIKIGEEDGKNGDIYYFEYIPFWMNQDAPIFEKSLQKNIQNKYGFSDVESLCNHLSAALQYLAEERRALQKTIAVEKEKKTEEAVKKEEEIFLEEVKNPHQIFVPTVQPESQQTMHQLYETSLEIIQLRMENKIIVLENKKYQHLLSMNSKILSEQDTQHFYAIAPQEFDELQSSLKYLEKLWENHQSLVRLLSENIERKSLIKKRERFLEIKDELFDLKVRKIIDSMNGIKQRKIRGAFFFKKYGKIKVLKADYEKIAEIKEFSHFIEEENYRIEGLLKQDF